MATKTKQKEKRREARLFQKQRKLAKQTQVEELEHQEDELDDVSVLEDESGEVEDVAPVEKSYDDPSYADSIHYVGPVSWTEADAMEEANEKANEVRKATWTAEDLVRNIIYRPDMTPDQKGKAIADVGVGFGERVKSITSTKVKKEISTELLQLQALIAIDKRKTPIVEKAVEWIGKNFIKKDTEFPVSTKSETRYSLSKIADILEKEENTDYAKEALPEVYKAAKQFNIGHEQNAVIVEKDLSGSYRAILWPTNNFIDRDGEIISDEAHRKYVEWVNKNMEFSPLFMAWHIPGSERTHQMDFVGYQDGFMLMSCPLEESEARSILTLQKEVDLGLSIGGLATQRDAKSPNVVTEYFIVEVSDLPLERAANPFTEFSAVINKEADVLNQEEYLAGIVGADKAKQLLEKAGIKQSELRKSGVTEKEVKTDETPVAPPAVGDFDKLVERLAKEFGLPELSETIVTLKEAADKVPVLEAVVKELSKSAEDKVVEMITPPIAKNFSWVEKRASASDSTVVDPDKEEDKTLQKAIPQVGWLSEATNTVAVK